MVIGRWLSKRLEEVTTRFGQQRIVRIGQETPADEIRATDRPPGGGLDGERHHHHPVAGQHAPVAQHDAVDAVDGGDPVDEHSTT